MLDQLLADVYDECLRSPAATLDGGHLRGVVLDRVLGAGHGVVEPTAEARVGRLLRLDDAVMRVERVPVPARRPTAGGRPARPPDLRLWTPERLDVDLFARGTFWAPAPTGLRALHDRLARVAAGATDALLLACDRRSYDTLRRGPVALTAGDGARRGSSALAALCEAVLPPSSALSQAFAEQETDVGRGQWWVARGAVTPMVFGVQRVVLALRLRTPAGRKPIAEPRDEPPAQLDAFTP